MDYPLALQLLGLVLAIYLLTTYLIPSFPTLRNKRIVLLIAHPDDEAMFFAPTLLALTSPRLNNQVLVLCLSSGDADGLGHVRKGELVRSARMLGVTHDEHVVVIEDASKFRDGMKESWDPREVAKVLGHYFAPEMARTKTDEAPKAAVDVVVTFDEGGVSGHPNHSALFHGAKVFLGNLMQRHRGWECPVKLYALGSLGVVRKYASIVDCAVTVLGCLVRKREAGGFPSPVLGVSGPLGVWRAQRAMVNGHKSQMRWFRWGWIGVSRYMVVNDLSKVKV